MADGRSMVRSGGEVPHVVVVGAGVSGCACGAALANRGVRVTLVNGALDGVNLPAYGPHLAAGPKGWSDFASTMELLPLALRLAWLTSAAVPECGAPVLVVDRRAVSIETKRALERIPGLSFRQALASDLRVIAAPHGGSTKDTRAGTSGDTDSSGEGRALVALDTAFGESFEADAVVVAAGLGLGGRVDVGEDSMPGGRYGETVGDGLKVALERIGAILGDAVVEVGTRFAGREAELVGAFSRLDSRYRRERMIDVQELVNEDVVCLYKAGRESLEVARQALTGAFSGGSSHRNGDSEDSEHSDYALGSWPDSYPPSVHWRQDVAIKEMVFGAASREAPLALVSSDGRATAEVYVSPEGEHLLDAALGSAESGIGAGRGADAVATRLRHVIRGHAVQNLGPHGRLTAESGSAPPVWVVGRAAGASSYLTSLRSGALTGLALARLLLKDGAGRRDGGKSC
jgi:hypothetical protein